MGKNQRRKVRRYEQKKNDIPPSARFDLVRKLAEKWGKKLQIERVCDPTAGSGGTEQYVVHLAFGDVPFIVLGAKGIGRTAEEAESNCAWNLMSFFQEYLGRESMAELRKKWTAAEKEIDEAVKVCRLIEEELNSEQFCQLKTVAILDVNPPEKAWARQLRLELRKMYAKKRLAAAAASSTSAAASSTIFTKQAKTGLKRKISDASSEKSADDCSTKKSKACQVGPMSNSSTEWNADEYDEDGLHFTYISPLPTSSSSPSPSSSVVCLDNQEEDDEDGIEVVTQVTKQQVAKAKPLINIATSSGAVPSAVAAKISSNNSINDRLQASFFERNLIGVNFNTAASPIAGKIRDYRQKFAQEFAALDGETDEVYQWKMEVRNILLTEFRPAFPHRPVELFAVGSTVNGCGSYNSDMDLCLCIPTDIENIYSSERIVALKTLRKLNTIIKGKPSLRRVVRSSEVIPAKVPIIKMSLHPPYEELDLDINVNNTAGIYNSHLIHYYARIDQRFPAVCLLVKHWAITNGIGDAATGSFNSYSLILLVLHYFQCGVQPAVLPNLQFLYPDKFGSTPPLSELHLFQDLNTLPQRPPNNQTVGELLVGFFHYYAAFDFENIAISMRNSCVISRSQMPPDTYMYCVFIEEPFDRNNTARCVTKPYVMDRIRKAFRFASEAFSKHPPSLQRIKVTV
ncbi:hypothetical protein Q1695_003566 [Nippostrongylus brasiliensis]|nr:hypothetical protein Q1695_003566 [Nippostrongylus brasiliensis]